METIPIHHTFTDAHAGPIRCLAITSNNRYVITGSDDTSMKIFDIENKECIYTFKYAHNGDILCLDLSYDDKYLVSGSWDGSIKIWDLEEKKTLSVLPKAHNGHVKSVAISKDSRFLVSGGSDSKVKLWDMATNELIHTFHHHSGEVNAVAISENNSYIISGSNDYNMRVFSMEQLEPIESMTYSFDGIVSTVVVTHNSEKVIAGSWDRSIQIFDLVKQKCVCRLREAHEETIECVALSGGSQKYFAACDGEGTVKLYDLTKLKTMATFQKVHEGSCNVIRFTSDDRYLVTGGSDGVLRVLDLSYYLEPLITKSHSKVNVTKAPEGEESSAELKSLIKSQQEEIEKLKSERTELELELHELKRASQEMKLIIEGLNNKLQHLGVTQEEEPVNTESLNFIHKKMEPNSTIFDSVAYVFERRGVEMPKEEFKRRVSALKKLVAYYVLCKSSILSTEDYQGKTPEEYVAMLEDENYKGGLAELKIFIDHYQTEIKVFSDGELLSVPVHNNKSYEKVALFLKDTAGGIHYEPIVGVLPDAEEGVDFTIFSIDDNKPYTEGLKISKALKEIEYFQ